jgi:hypothetical protein
MPKATVQAAIGGAVLDRAKDEIDELSVHRAEYEDYGNSMLTTAVIAIIITAPLGAFLTNNLGVRWLNKTESKKY